MFLQSRRAPFILIATAIGAGLLAAGCSGSGEDAAEATTAAASTAATSPEVGSTSATTASSEGTPDLEKKGAIAVASEPEIVAVGAGSVWVSSRSGSVSRIDPRTNSVIARIRLPVRGTSWIAAEKRTVWVAVVGRGKVTLVRIDPKRDKVVARVDVGSGSGPPSALAVGAGAVWVALFDESKVARIDPQTNAVLKKIVTDEFQVGAPSGIAIAEGAVWAANHREGTVIQIDPKTNRVARRLRVELEEGAGPGRLSAGGDSLWLASAGGQTVARIEPRANRVSATLTGCPSVNVVAFGLGSVWGAQLGLGSVCEIDPTTKRTKGSVRIGKPGETTAGPNGSPVSVAVGFGSLWVTDFAGDRVVRLERTD